MATDNPSSNVFLGNRYRITVLTERLIRIEYNDQGIFEDRNTELVQNRIFEVPEFKVAQNDYTLIIQTKYFKLEYKKEAKISASKLVQNGALKVTLNETDKEWHYGHPEVRNLLGTSTSLDDKNIPIRKGLFSIDGFASIDDSKSLIINPDSSFTQREVNGVDTYLFMYKRDFGLALSDYFKLSGLPPLIPRYAFGVWWSRDASYKTNDIVKIINDFKIKEIPLSIVLLDRPWHLKKYNDKDITTSYTFDTSLIPAPYDLINYIHSGGIRVGLNINPIEGIYPNESNYSSFLSDAKINSDGNPIKLNLHNRAVMQSYYKNIIEPLKKLGVDFFWNDLYLKKNPEQLYVFNHFQSLYDNRDINKRGLMLSRATTVAPHRFSVHYSGRLNVSRETLRNLPSFNSSAANMGISWWSHDIGGFSGGIEDRELYTRFVQFGVFSPIFRFSFSKGKYYHREPWKWDLKTFEIVRNYMKLRHKLIPYIYTESYKYHKLGVPFIQPLYYMVPTILDNKSYKNEYFFGSEMLVAPILEKEEALIDRVFHKFYLPSGIWYDFRTGKKFIGGKGNMAFYKNEEYPVFCKSGAIIPLSSISGKLNDTDNPDILEINIFPGSNNSYTLYEDDGVSNNYKNGKFFKTLIDYRVDEESFLTTIKMQEGSISVIPEVRTFKIRYRNTRIPDEVTVNIGREKSSFKSYTENNDFFIEVTCDPTKEIFIVCRGSHTEIEALNVINEDIDLIIFDLQINTDLKEKISEIMFSDIKTSKKRIAIRKLKRDKLEAIYVKLFLRLLEYIDITYIKKR